MLPINRPPQELVSFRSINLMDETFIVEHIKDQVLFVSDNMTRDLEAARRGRNSPFRRVESLRFDWVASALSHTC